MDAKEHESGLGSPALHKLLGLFRKPRDNRETGAFAEHLAAEWLRRERGFTVIARNWRSPRDKRQELDLVCRDGEVLVFVEVKARVAGSMVAGYFAVDRRKKRVMLQAAKAYLARLRPKPRTFRCDVVEVTMPRAGGSGAARRGEDVREPQVRHFQNVPLFADDYRW
jgi:putative endonuclease